jgi:hypothetical protein
MSRPHIRAAPRDFRSSDRQPLTVAQETLCPSVATAGGYVRLTLARHANAPRELEVAKLQRGRRGILFQLQ